VGDEVILAPNTTWLQGFEQRDLPRLGVIGSDHLDGSLRQYAIIASDDHLISKPLSLSFEEAAAIPTAGGTAVHALFHGTQPILPGNTVVTQGTGGVSLIAIQLAAAAGATVIATSSSDEKLKVAKQAGATHLINYKTSPDWDKEVLRLTGGQGADFILDIGGPATFAKSLAAVRTGGEVSVVGLLGFTEQAPSLNEVLPTILVKGIRVKGVCSFSRPMVQQAVDIFVARGIQPVVGQSWAWEDAKAALENLASGQVVGKSVVRIK